jgi:MSHA pilin protein MshC
VDAALTRVAVGTKRATRGRRAGGFTMVELITVIILIGILGAIGATRFFDNNTAQARAYADQVKAMVRQAQKLAIAQNRNVFVRARPAGFAVCFTSACGTAADLATAPSGNNSGATNTRTFCTLSNVYTARWLCEGTPPQVAVAGAGTDFYFDPLGRPADPGGAAFARLQWTMTSGTSKFTVSVEPESGYVY